MPATIWDVANEVGVSIRTVSRVLNDSPFVNEKTRASVKAAIERLGFSPNSRARALASSRSNLIGLIHEEVNAAVLDQMQRGIIDVCAPRHVELVIHPSSGASPTVLEDVEAFLRRSRVDGVVVGPPMAEVKGLPELLERLGVPAIGAAAMALSGYDGSFRYEERAATAQIARLLLDLGHRRIGLVRGPERYRSAHERAEGFCGELVRAGVTIAPHHIGAGNYGFVSGIEAALPILATPDRPTAIFASNDYMAAGVMKAAALSGISVPAQLSVVGFDDSEMATMLHPSLTTVRRPVRELARRMTERLFDAIAAPAGTRGHGTPLPVPLELVARESTRPPA